MNHTIISRNTFSILFFIHTSKINKNGEYPIYCRVTVQGKSREFSTQIWTQRSKWQPSPTAKIFGTNEASKTANYALNSIRTNLSNIRADLQCQGKPITSQIVVDIHLGKSEKRYTLIELHNYFNEQYVKPLIEIDYAGGTYSRYKTSLEHVKEFMAHKYKINDILLNDLSYSFATDYEFYLKKEKSCAHNTTIKYIKNLKAVINYAVGQEWIKNNPLERYKGKLQRVEKEFLTQEELSVIETKELGNERLNEVRDVFVLCCYTGLAYSDSAKLSKKNIVVGIKGGKQISIKRTKTDTLANIPLLPKALEIIEKYKDNEFCLYNDRLLPIKSNQKQNAYLKEIATICGCSKKLTTHTARHTFATLMLTKGVTIETVSSVLGHTNIKTTQIYGKIIQEKVNDEMSKVREQLKAI
jgi:site-specific recombinase XerD